MSDGDEPTGDHPSLPGRRFGPPEKAAIVAAVIVAVGTILSTTLAGVFNSSSGGQAAQPPAPRTASNPGPQRVGTPLTPPLNPALTLYDPKSTGVTSVAFTASGDLVAGDLNGSAYLWDLSDAQHTATFPSTNGQGIFGVSVNPGGTILAVTTLNGTYTKGGIVLWDMATGKPTAILNDPDGRGAGNPVAWHGGMLAAADSDGDVYLWDIQSRKLVSAFPDPDSKGVTGGVAFSPRSRVLAATANNAKGTRTAVCVWNGTYKLVATFHDPDSQGAYRLAFSPDGSVLAVGDANAHTHIWTMHWLTPGRDQRS